VTEFWPFFEGLGALAALFAWLGAALILFSYRATIGALLSAIVSAIQGISIPTPFGGIDIGRYLAAPISALDNTVNDALSAVVDATQFSWHFWMHALASTLDWIGGALSYDMHEVGKAFQALRRSTIPSLISAAISAALHPLSFLLATLERNTSIGQRLLHGAVSAVEGEVSSLERTALSEIHHLENEAKGAVSAAIAVTLPGIHGLDRDVSGIQAWIKANAKKLTAAGIVGLVAAALENLGLGNSRCSNNKKFTKSVCGLSSKVLDDLLAGLVAIVGSVSLLQFAEEYQKLVPGLTSEIRTFWRVTSGTAAKDRALGQSGF